MKRQCTNCSKPIPPETEHFTLDNSEIYCTECVEVTSYNAYMYYVDGEYLGNSEDDSVQHVEMDEDLYEEDEGEQS